MFQRALHKQPGGSSRPLDTVRVRTGDQALMTKGGDGREHPRQLPVRLLGELSLV